MFRGELDADVVDMIVEQFNGDQQAALETLLQMSAVSVDGGPSDGGGSYGFAEEKNCFKGIITTTASEIADSDNDSPPILNNVSDAGNESAFDEAAVNSPPESEMDVAASNSRENDFHSPPEVFPTPSSSVSLASSSSSTSVVAAVSSPYADTTVSNASLSAEAPVFVPRFAPSIGSSPSLKPPVPRHVSDLPNYITPPGSNSQLPSLDAPASTRLPHSALLTSTPETLPSTSRYSQLVSDLGVAMEKMSEEKKALAEETIHLMGEMGKIESWDDKPKPQRESKVNGDEKCEKEDVLEQTISVNDEYDPKPNEINIGIEKELLSEQSTPIPSFDQPLPQRSRVRKYRTDSPGKPPPQLMQQQQSTQKEKLQQQLIKEKESLQEQLEKQQVEISQEVEKEQKHLLVAAKEVSGNKKGQGDELRVPDTESKRQKKRSLTPKPSIAKSDENANFAIDSMGSREWPSAGKRTPAAQDWPAAKTQASMKPDVPPSGAIPKQSSSWAAMAKDLPQQGISPGRQGKVKAKGGNSGIDKLWMQKKAHIENLVKKEDKKVMILMRGCSGSGKSSLAQILRLDNKTSAVCSTDDFFTHEGRYDFERSKLSQAHEWNVERVEWFVKQGKDNPVIVDNTNTEKWEMIPYARLAAKHGYHVEIMEPETPWAFNAKTLLKKNKHNVQLDTIKLMIARYEKHVSPSDLLKKTEKSTDEATKRDAAPRIDSSVLQGMATTASAEMTSLAPKTPFMKKSASTLVPISVGKNTPPSENDGTDVNVTQEIASLVSQVDSLALNTHTEADEISAAPKNPSLDAIVDYSSSDYESAEDEKEQKGMMAMTEKSVKDDLSSSVVKSPRALLLEKNLNGFQGHHEDDEFVSMDDEVVSVDKDLSISAIKEKVQDDAAVPEEMVEVDASSKNLLNLTYESDPDDDTTPPEKPPPVIHRFSKPRLDENLKSNLMADNRWDFPAFPVVSGEMSPLSPLVTIRRPSLDAGTFTDSADFLFLRQTLELSDLGPNNRVQLQDYLIVGAHARTITTDDMQAECSLSKGCSVNNEVGEGALLLEAVVFLKECFPNCRASLLDSILEKCGGDTELAVEVIVNLGYDVEDVDEPFVSLPPPGAYPRDMGPPPPGAYPRDLGLPAPGAYPRDKEDTDEILDVDIGQDANNISVNKTPQKKIHVQRTSIADTLKNLTLDDAPVKAVEEDMMLNLDTPLLNSLQEKFGALPLNTEQSVQYLQGCGLALQLDDRVGKLFYQFLKAALGSPDEMLDVTPKVPRASAPSCENDAAIALLLQTESGANRHFRPSAESLGKSNDLRQIMEEEKIITNKFKEQEASRKAASRAAGGEKAAVRHSLSSQLKFQKLHEMFCEVDEDMLEATFALHHYGFEQTVNSLKAAGVKLRTEVYPRSSGIHFTDHLEVSSSAVEVEDSVDEMPIEDVGYEVLRSDAYMHHRKRAQLFQKAQRAFESNMRPAAFYYSQLAHQEGEKVRAANNRASEILFHSKHEVVERSNKLDLHSLHVDEAVKLVKEILSSRLSELGQSSAARVGKNKSQITIITGRGNHSRGGNAKLRPSVINYLKQHNYYFTETNPGVLEVYLRQSLGAS